MMLYYQAMWRPSYSDLITAMENACNREATPPLVDGRPSEDFIIEQEMMLRGYLQFAGIPLIQYHGFLECTSGKWKIKDKGEKSKRASSSPPSSNPLRPIRRSHSLSSIDTQPEDGPSQQRHGGDNADQFDILVLRSQLKRKRELEKKFPCGNCTAAVKQEIISSQGDVDPRAPMNGNRVVSRRKDSDRKIKMEEVQDDLGRPATPPAALSPSPPPSPIGVNDDALQPSEDQMETNELNIPNPPHHVQVNVLAGLNEPIDPDSNNEISMGNKEKTDERQSSSESPNLTATNSYGSTPDRPHSTPSPGLVIRNTSYQRITDGDSPVDSSPVGTSSGSSGSDRDMKIEEGPMAHSSLENGLSAMSIGTNSSLGIHLGQSNIGVEEPKSSRNHLIPAPSMPHIVMHRSQSSKVTSIQVHPRVPDQHLPHDLPCSSQQHPSLQPLPRVFETFGVDPPNPRNRNYPGLLEAIIRYNGPIPINREIMKRLCESHGIDWPWTENFYRQLRVDLERQNAALQAAQRTQTTHHLTLPPTIANHPPIQPPQVAPRGRPPSISIHGGDPLTNRQPQPLPIPHPPISSVSSAVPFVVQQPQPFGVLAHQMALQANGFPQNWAGLPVPWPVGFNPQIHFGRPIPPQPTAPNLMRPPTSQSVQPVIQPNLPRPPPPQSVQPANHPGMIRSQSVQPIILHNMMRPAPPQSVYPVNHPSMARSQTVQNVIHPPQLAPSHQVIVRHNVIRTEQPFPIQPAHHGLIKSQSGQPMMMRAGPPQIFHPTMHPPQPVRSQSIQHAIVNNETQPASSSSVYPPQPSSSKGTVQFPTKKIINHILERFEKMGIPRSHLIKEQKNNDPRKYQISTDPKGNTVPKERVARKRKAPTGLDGCRPDKEGRHNFFPPPPPPPAIC